MLVYFEQDMQRELATKGRFHPWTTSTSNPDNQYVDFKQNPHLIESSLEDLHQYPGSEVSESVIEFMKWANGPLCIFETNDFGLRPIKENTSGVSSASLELHGRIVMLFRELKRNINTGQMMKFMGRTESLLKREDANFSEACIGWCLWPHLFESLQQAGQPAEGHCFHFPIWAWGDAEADTHRHFARALQNLRSALTEVGGAMFQ